MTEPGGAQAYVECRRARLAATLDRAGEAPHPFAGEGMPPQQLEFFRKEAEDLFWNELSWEQITGEEAVAGGHLTELVFPGFLAFVEGLLVEKVPADSLAPARPHPDAVEEILTFLGERWATYTAEVEAGADSERLVWARAMTAELIDLVLYRLYHVSRTEREQVDAVG